MYDYSDFDRLGMVDGGVFNARATLSALQDGDVWIYAILTREGAVKIGSSTDLATRKKNIKFGGTRKLMAFRPGDLRMERNVQGVLSEHLIPGTREYFYPHKQVMAQANWMRSYWGIEPLPNNYLPRMSECTFHRRVMDAQVRGTSVF